ncbi:MAG: hypothetical protein GVY20_04340 [Bacteroidetes bacterium]|jgi:hypothetical protein|nr:hypothetical protein [Bacteroidota bacterium]
MRQAITTIKQVIIAIILMLSSMQALAQNSPTETSREGFVIGLSAGASYLSIEGDAFGSFEDSGLSLPNLKIGWMISPKTALLLSIPGMGYEIDGVDRSFDSVVPSIQYWVRPKWWVNVGFGLGMDSVAFYEDDHGQDKLNVGPAGMISTGFEIYKRGKFTIDLQGTIHAGQMYTDGDHYEAGALLAGVGFNFY